MFSCQFREIAEGKNFLKKTIRVNVSLTLNKFSKLQRRIQNPVENLRLDILRKKKPRLKAIINYLKIFKDLSKKQKS